MNAKDELNFIVIYSDGPMGSTNLGAIFEKYGYINLPFRKFLLSEYVMGIKDITDKSMQYKCLYNIDSLSQKTILGGVSVKDRNSRESIIRALRPTKKNTDQFLSFNPKNIYELISHCFLFTAKHIIYKEFKKPIKGFVIYEMPQFKINYQFTQVEYINKLTNLRNFKFFLMNRSFKEWCASILSQEDYKKSNDKSLNTISIEKLFRRWRNINNYANLKRVHTIQLESILLPNTEKTNLLIASKLDLEYIDYKEILLSKFDLFGSLLPFKKAFKPSDKAFDELNPIFKIMLILFPKVNLLLRLICDLIINILRKFGFFRAYMK